MLGNWIRMTTTSTGTGTLSLSSVSGYPTIANYFANNERFQYAILNDSDGTPIEAGIGYVTSGTTLNREKVINTYVSGSLSVYPTAANLAAGTYRVIVTALANGTGASLPSIHSSSTRYYIPSSYGVAANTKSITADYVYYTAGMLEVSAKVTGMVCQVLSAAGTSSNKLRMGIYTVDKDGLPGAVVAETADADPSTTGVKTPAFSSAIALPCGHYYLGVITDVGVTVVAGAAGGFRGNQVTSLGVSSINNYYGYGYDTNSGSTFSGWTTMPSYVGMAFVALASDFPPTLGLTIA